MQQRLRNHIAGRFVGVLAALLLGAVVAFATRPAAAANDGPGVRIPDMLVRLAAETAPAYVLVVEKATQRLSLYADDPRSGLRLAVEMDCSTGKVDGNKAVAGDMKTPEGVYFLTRKFPDRDLSPRYGVAAYPLDYPHLLDREAGRNGHSIWLHGTDRPLRPRDSNGCIALDNKDLVRLDPYITINRTAVLITERVASTTPDAASAVARGLSDLLARWRGALETGSYQDFLALYAPAYLPPIAWWPEWSMLRREVAALGGALALDVRQADMYRHGATFVLRFDLQATTGAGAVPVAGRKLFVTEGRGGLRIIGDEYLQPPDAVAVPQEDPLVVAARDLKSVLARDREIPALVDRWLAAWSAKDIEDYAGCYAADFSADGMDRDTWLSRKRQLNRKYRYIRVRRGEMTVTHEEPLATVTFRQHYRSDAYQAQGIKTLRLKREAGRWKICGEAWRRR